VFHVVFIKKFEGSPPAKQAPLSPIVRGRAVAQPDSGVSAPSRIFIGAAGALAKEYG
jgi:hypothetical protein